MNVINIDDQIAKIEGLKQTIDAENHVLAPQHSGGKGSFRWLVVGATGKGKTNVVISAITQAHIKFDHLYMYVKDPNQSKYLYLQKWLNELENRIEEQTGDKVSVYTVISNVKEIIPIKDIPSDRINLAIFDDLMLVKHQELIEEYFIVGRHKNMSCIYMTQDYHETPKIIREQCNYFSIFEPNSQGELKQLCMSQSMTCDYKVFKEIMDKATDDGKSFLFIDRRTTHKELKLRKNFDELWDYEHHQFFSINPLFFEQ